MWGADVRQALILPRRVIRKTSRGKVSFGKALKDGQELARQRKCEKRGTF